MSNSQRLIGDNWLSAPGFQKLPCRTSPELDEAGVLAVDALTVLEIKCQLGAGNTSVDAWWLVVDGLWIFSASGSVISENDDCSWSFIKQIR